MLPVYNHHRTIGQVIGDIIDEFPNELLIVVNDGSTDGTAEAIETVQNSRPSAKIKVYTHEANRGKGSALMTGFQAAEQAGCTHAITIDADGQHHLNDAARLIAVAKLFPDELIVGDRQIDRHPTPKNSRRGRDMSRFWLWLQTGMDVPDPQCGLRVYPLADVLAVRCLTHRYDFETEITARLAWKGLRVVSAPITCIYFSPEQRVTHFRPFIDTTRGTWINVVLTTLRILSLPPGRPRTPCAYEPISLLRTLRDRRNWRKILNLNGCMPLESSLIAAAVGIGVLIAFIPAYGLQTILAIYIARRLHLNVPLMVLATQISIPPLSIGVILVSLMCGHLIIHGTWPPVSISALHQHTMWYWLAAFTGDLLLGGVVCGLIAGTISLLSTRMILRACRREKTKSTKLSENSACMDRQHLAQRG
ncbi:MAG: DUF2062 domain-containing protein [Phycisphaerae bacterium]